MKLSSLLVPFLVFVTGALAQTQPPTPKQAPQPKCEMSQGDRVWIESAVRNWTIAEGKFLRQPPSPLPTIVVVDRACSYVAPPRPDRRLHWKATPHQGMVTLPDGNRVPVGVMSFAAPSEGGKAAFFVMSLPSIWKEQNVSSPLGVEGLMDGVLLHEMAHTRQFYFANPALEALTRKYGLPDDINDDSLQEAFKGNAKYVADYERERDLLYAAALSASDAEAKRLAREALTAMRTRRATWFKGPDEKWAPLDEVFLTMEGLGQWLIYAWFTDPAGRRLDRDAALDLVRRKRNRWSQDEGLALFMVINRLVPNWQAHAFATKPATAERLLEMAAGTR